MKIEIDGDTIIYSVMITAVAAILVVLMALTIKIRDTNKQISVEAIRAGLHEDSFSRWVK